jgi:hypothetical protein
MQFSVYRQAFMLHEPKQRTPEYPRVQILSGRTKNYPLINSEEDLDHLA